MILEVENSNSTESSLDFNFEPKTLTTSYNSLSIKNTTSTSAELASKAYTHILYSIPLITTSTDQKTDPFNYNIITAS
jgi:hypothetical protein